MDKPEDNATELLLAFESEHDPFRYIVRGHSLWTALRFGVWERLKIAMGGLTLRGTKPTGTRVATRLRSGLSEWRTYRALAAGRHRCEVLALTSSNRLRDPDGERWRNTYYDYFSEPLPTTLHYYIDSKGRREPRSDASVFVSSQAHSARMAMAKRGDFEGREAVAALHAELGYYLRGATPGVECPVSRDALAHEAVRFGVLYDAMIKVLEGTDASVVLSDCYYDRTWAVAAARSRGVPVFELQHGIVYDGHIAYRFDPATVSAHRATLPVPDRVLSFGPQSSSVFSSGGPWSADDILDTGFPRMQAQQRGYHWDPPQPGAPLVLLVSAQWILSSRLRAFLEELATQLSPQIEIHVKPHPLDAVGAYEGIDGVSVMAPQADFYRSLRGAHVHASVFSTTLVESVGLGVPTVVLGLPGAENAQALVERGSARRVESPGALAALLEGCRAEADALSAWRLETLNAAPYFWTADPSENIQRLLEATVSRSS